MILYASHVIKNAFSSLKNRVIGLVMRVCGILSERDDCREGWTFRAFLNKCLLDEVGNLAFGHALADKPRRAFIDDIIDTGCLDHLCDLRLILHSAAVIHTSGADDRLCIRAALHQRNEETGRPGFVDAKPARTNVLRHHSDIVIGIRKPDFLKWSAVHIEKVVEEENRPCIVPDEERKKTLIRIKSDPRKIPQARRIRDNQL